MAAIRQGHAYEITTFRSEVYQDDSRKPQVEFSGDVMSDLSRRDFTINAIALRFPSQSWLTCSVVWPI